MKKKIILTSLLSMASGWINGFLGGGGGVLTVTLLLTVFALPQKKAQATAMAIILPVTAVSAFVYLMKNSLPYVTLGFAALGVAIGGTIGAVLLNRLNGNAVKLIFGLFLVAGGVKMLLAI